MSPWIGNALVLITWAINLELVVYYHRASRGAWRDSPVGRHVMAFMSAILAVITLASVRVVLVDIFHEPDFIWFQVLRSVTFLFVPAVFIWRRRIIASGKRSRHPVTWKDSDGDDSYRDRAGDNLLEVSPVEREQRRRRHADPRQPRRQEGPAADQGEGRRARMGDGGQRLR